jgi:hypothetical protein
VNRDKVVSAADLAVVVRVLLHRAAAAACRPASPPSSAALGDAAAGDAASGEDQADVGDAKLVGIRGTCEIDRELRPFPMRWRRRGRRRLRGRASALSTGRRRARVARPRARTAGRARATRRRPGLTRRAAPKVPDYRTILAWRARLRRRREVKLADPFARPRGLDRRSARATAPTPASSGPGRSTRRPPDGAGPRAWGRVGLVPPDAPSAPGSLTAALGSLAARRRARQGGPPGGDPGVESLATRASARSRPIRS